MRARFVNEDVLQPARVSGMLYHTSIPKERNKIAKEGLVPQERSARWLEDTMELGSVIFASTSKKNIWDSTFDDDVYEIDSEKIYNEWFYDPNFNWKKKTTYVLTSDPIPPEALRLIHKGTGETKI